MHLLYARFFTKAMADVGLVHEREPFKRLFNQGQILGADGERMSKSRGNVQDPDELVSRYGADTVRLFLMFMGPWDQGGPWSPTGIGGIARFLNRVWYAALDPHGIDAGDAESGTLPGRQDAAAAEKALRTAAMRTLATVTEKYAELRFNTMVAHLMELSNLLQRYRGTEIAGGEAWNEAVRLLLLMLAPAAPHIAEELWFRLADERGEAWTSIHTATWPSVDELAAAQEEREVPVQVNGKLRDKVTVPVDMAEVELEKLVLARPKVIAALDGKTPLKVIHAGGKLINIVVR
jgi:leucyl-tRNA synthetase